jgi:hypothetical protein
VMRGFTSFPQQHDPTDKPCRVNVRVSRQWAIQEREWSSHSITYNFI